MLGVPCLKYRCSECCIETEMQLSNRDIEILESLGYSDFYETTSDGWTVLRNINGKCIFIHDGLCTVYNHRPEGCLIYPLFYDDVKKVEVLDSDCVHREEFKPSQKDIDRLRSHVKQLKLERKTKSRKLHP